MTLIIVRQIKNGELVETYNQQRCTLHIPFVKIVTESIIVQSTQMQYVNYSFLALSLLLNWVFDTQLSQTEVFRD